MARTEFTLDLSHLGTFELRVNYEKSDASFDHAFGSRALLAVTEVHFQLLAFIEGNSDPLDLTPLLSFDARASFRDMAERLAREDI